MPGAVWRLAWFESGAAILFGLAPGNRPGRFFVVRHDAANAHREGIFEKHPDGTWSQCDGDGLEPESSDVLRMIGVTLDDRGRRRRIVGRKRIQQGVRARLSR